MELPINRHGRCPNPACNCDWDGGDIREALAKMEIYSGVQDKTLDNIAYQAYGYTPENKKRFSNAIGITLTLPDEEMANPDHLKCPVCGFIWNVTTGAMFESIYALKRGLEWKEIPQETMDEEKEKIPDYDEDEEDLPF